MQDNGPWVSLAVGGPQLFTPVRHSGFGRDGCDASYFGIFFWATSLFPDAIGGATTSLVIARREEVKTWERDSLAEKYLRLSTTKIWWGFLV